MRAHQNGRHERGAKPYVEAFPAIDILRLEHEARWSAGLCQWTDADGRVVGHVSVVSIAPDKLVFEQTFFGTINIEEASGRNSFYLDRRSAGGSERPSIICLGCGRKYGLIYFVAKRWLCRRCHDICHISQRAPDVVIKMHRRDQLERLIKQGRQRYGRHTAMAAAKEEYQLLVSELANAGDWSDYPELRYYLEAHWLKDRAMLKEAVEPGEAGYGWSPYDGTGFKRLGWIARRDEEVATLSAPAPAAPSPDILADPLPALKRRLVMPRLGSGSR